MLKTIFSTIIEISIITSIIITILAILSAFITKRYAAKWRCIVWAVILLRLIVPINITLPTAPIVLPEPPKQEVIKSSAFQLASFNTFRFIAIGVPLIMIVSTVFSLMLQSKFSGASFFRSIFLYPLVIPIASTIMVFQIIFSDSGILNTILESAGMPIESWINSDKAFGVLIILYIWKNCGYNIVLLLAGLNSIPPEFYEVAEIEGASKWQSFRKVTMPIMMPSFFFVFVISIINSFKSFREAFLLSGAMPHKSIYMLQHFMNNNFANLNYQRLSVAALLVFLVIFTFVFILFRLRKKAGDIQL